MIQPSSLIVIPAQEAITADGIWISRLAINAPDPTQPIAIVAQLVPYVSSTAQLLPELGKTLVISDLAAVAQTDQTVANAMNALFLAVQSQIQAQGLY